MDEFLLLRARAALLRSAVKEAGVLQNAGSFLRSAFKGVTKAPYAVGEEAARAARVAGRSHPEFGRMSEEMMPLNEKVWSTTQALMPDNQGMMGMGLHRDDLLHAQNAAASAYDQAHRARQTWLDDFASSAGRKAESTQRLRQGVGVGAIGAAGGLGLNLAGRAMSQTPQAAPQTSEPPTMLSARDATRKGLVGGAKNALGGWWKKMMNHYGPGVQQ